MADKKKTGGKKNEAPISTLVQLADHMLDQRFGT